MKPEDVAGESIFVRVSPREVGGFEVSDVTGKQRGKLSAAHLAAMVGGGQQATGARMAVSRGGFSTLVGAGAQAWLADAWAIPARFLLGASSADFADSGVDYREHRRNAVADYQQSVPLPPADRLASGSPTHKVGLGLSSRVALGEVLLARRTRRFDGRSMSRHSFDQILSEVFEYSRRHRNPPREGVDEMFESFGSAFDVMVVVHSVDGIEPGVYWYQMNSNVLLQTPQEAYPDDFIEALTNHQGLSNGFAAALVLVADLDRYMWRYRHDRALRNLLFDAGRVGQAIVVSATAQGYATVCCAPLDNTQLVGRLPVRAPGAPAIYAVVIGSTMSPETNADITNIDGDE